MTYNFNNETLVLVIRGTGTLSRKAEYTSATHITVEGFTKISDACFSYYTQLLTISLTDSVVTLGNNFLTGTRVAEVHLPKSVRYLSSGQSFDCYYSLGNITVDPENPYFCSVNGVLFSKNMKELHFYPGNRTEIT